jgi:hypothetical protein
MVVLSFLLIAVILSQILMCVNRRENVGWIQASFMLLVPNGKEYLTEKGIFWRKMFWICTFVFCSIVAAILFSDKVQSLLK